MYGTLVQDSKCRQTTPMSIATTKKDKTSTPEASSLPVYSPGLTADAASVAVQQGAKATRARMHGDCRCRVIAIQGYGRAALDRHRRCIALSSQDLLEGPARNGQP